MSGTPLEQNEQGRPGSNAAAAPPDADPAGGGPPAGRVRSRRRSSLSLSLNG